MELTSSPQDDFAQQVRVRRFYMAALTSVMVIFLLWIVHELGLLELRDFIVAAIAIAISIIVFYLLLRSGWNRKAADPSLTLPMIVVSATVNTYVLYALKDGRGAFLLIYLVSMLFGVFRLSSQQLLRITAFVLLSYALVIWQLARHNPATLNLSVELLQWVVLAFVLVWFSLMGGYINTLVTRLGQSEADELTGAYTRRRIIEILRHEKLRCDRGAGPLSVCMVDIDKLKQVNDTYGHQRGDEFLRAVVSAVQEELRVVDYIGRYGGDEFLLVLTQTPLVGAVDCAERIRSKVERQAVSESSPALAPSVSIGVAEYEMGETTIQTVVRADRALYRAKSGGRNRIECASSSIEQGGSAQQAL